MKGFIKRLLPDSLKKHIWRAINDVKEVCYRLSGCLGNFYIKYLVVIVGQACNYKCRDCSNFCPISPKEYKRYALEDIIADVECVLNKVKYIELLQIQGGEPLLYSDLGGVLHYLGGQKSRVHKIVIATNGSIVPKDELMELLHKYDVELRVSDYGRSQEKIPEIKSKCLEYSVAFRLYEFAGDDSRWFYMGGKDVKRTSSDSIVKKRMKSCAFRNCLTLERGELAHCSRAANSYHIQGFKRKCGDYVKVSDEDFGRLLKKYILQPKKMEACYYCYGTTTEHTVAAAIQEGEI